MYLPLWYTYLNMVNTWLTDTAIVLCTCCCILSVSGYIQSRISGISPFFRIACNKIYWDRTHGIISRTVKVYGVTNYIPVHACMFTDWLLQYLYKHAKGYTTIIDVTCNLTIIHLIVYSLLLHFLGQDSVEISWDKIVSPEISVSKYIKNIHITVYHRSTYYDKKCCKTFN